MFKAQRGFVKSKAKKPSVEHLIERELGRRPADIVVVDPGILADTGRLKKQVRRLYAVNGRILTIGDGDLSFSRSLMNELEPPAAGEEPRLFATTFDSNHDLLERYVNAESCLDTLNQRNCIVLHNVDARDIGNSLITHLQRALQRKTFTAVTKLPDPDTLVHSFSHLVFNFPHVGGRKAEDVAKDRLLLSEFFSTAGSLLLPSSISFKEYQSQISKLEQLKEQVRAGKAMGISVSAVSAREVAEEAKLGGQVHIAYKSSSFYSKVGLLEIAESKGFVLLKQLPFSDIMFPGYTPQQNNPLTSAIPMTFDNSFLYVFVRRSPTSLGEGEHLRAPKQTHRIESNPVGQVDESFLKQEAEEAKGAQAKPMVHGDSKTMRFAAASEIKSKTASDQDESATPKKETESRTPTSSQATIKAKTGEDDSTVVRKVIISAKKPIKLSKQMREDLVGLKRKTNPVVSKDEEPSSSPSGAESKSLGSSRTPTVAKTSHADRPAKPASAQHSWMGGNEPNEADDAVPLSSSMFSSFDQKDLVLKSKRVKTPESDSDGSDFDFDDSLFGDNDDASDDNDDIERKKRMKHKGLRKGQSQKARRGKR